MKYDLNFHLEKETKGTLRYEEEVLADNPVIGTLYIRKTALRGERPNTIIVTVSW